MMNMDLNAWMLMRDTERHFQSVEIVTQRSEGERGRYHFGDFALRVRKLITVLDTLGVSDGATVGTMAWNSSEHLELYFAIPCSGRIIHTINVRLAHEDLIYIINHAEDEALFVSPELVPLVSELLPALPKIRTVIVLGSTGDRDEKFLDYEDLVTQADPFLGERSIPENSPLGKCYTSGTTGRPKGVLYTHRSTVLHTLAVLSGNGVGLSMEDSLLPIVPMFHVNAWGLPYAGIAAGAKLVFPTPAFNPQVVIDLINEESVTKAAGVPTIWIAVLDQLRRSGGFLSPKVELLCGGSQPPPAVIEAFLQDYGVSLYQAWGMTECSPLATTTRTPLHLKSNDQAVTVAQRSRAGTPVLGMHIRICGPSGKELMDGEVGEVEIRAPWVLDAYIGGDSPGSFTADGWFRTGDVGFIDETQTLVLVDRTKDMIKSGGEWISSVTLEGLLMAHPKVREAAVVAVPDPQWGERPLAAVVLREGDKLSLEDARTFLTERGVPRWQLPDRLEVVQEIPRTSVGKFDKKVLRKRYCEP